MNQTEPIYVGIDWADAKHAFHLISGEGEEFGDLDQCPRAITAQLAAWRCRYPGAALFIAVETSKGPLISGLLEHEDVTIYPVNPAALANYRGSFAHGGGKNDPTDAQLLATYLSNYRHKLRPLRQDSPLTRELATLVEDRRRLVDQRTALANELTAVLKGYFPVILQLNAAKIYAEFLMKFLLKYPNLATAQRAGRARLTRFFDGAGAAKKTDQRVDTILDAAPLTTDEVAIGVRSRRAMTLCKLIVVLNQDIAGYDADLKRLVADHTDYEVVASLPGASTTTQARMIAALGDDRTRFENAESLQAASGIAPLTTQSGRQRVVSARWACSKFFRQTFHEYAGQSITQSKWAAAYYRRQLAKGKRTQAAKRALAYKWQRIIFRCWQSGEPYDEARYIERLRANNSPLIEEMELAGCL